MKALREAKQNSSWIAPHEDYERAVQEFVARILDGRIGIPARFPRISGAAGPTRRDRTAWGNCC